MAETHTPDTLAIRAAFALHQTNTHADIATLGVNGARELMQGYLAAFDRWAELHGIDVPEPAVIVEEAEVRPSEYE